MTRYRFLKIVNSKRYDTDKATHVCELQPYGYNKTNFAWQEVDLYVTENSNWFLAGASGPRGGFAMRGPDNTLISGEGILPLTPEMARAVIEQHGTPELVEEYFYETIEDA